MGFEALKNAAIKVLLCGSWRSIVWEINMNILEKPVASLSRVESVRAAGLLRCYAALIGSFFPKFQSNVQELLATWKWNPICCTEISVKQRCVTSRRANISYAPRRKLEITHRKEMHQVCPQRWYTFKKINGLRFQKIKIVCVLIHVDIL
jgi:hypothetical protein